MTNLTNDQHCAPEPSVAEMENIMDFAGSHSQKPHHHEEDVFDVEAIEDEEETNFINEEFNPEKNVTKVGFRKSGKAKGALVGAIGFLALVGGITFFQGQVPKDKVAEAPKKKDASDEKVENAQSDVTKAQQSESEIKAELALSKQKDALEQSNSTKANDLTNKTDPANKTTDKSATDPNTKTDPSTRVASSPAPSIPVVPPVRPNRTSGFVASPVVPPLTIPNNNNPTKVATAPAAPLVPPASKSNTSIPPSGVQPLPNISSSKLATATVGALVNKNVSSAAPSLPIASAPGVPKTPKLVATAPSKAPTPTESAPSISTREIARVEPVRNNTSIKETPISKKRASEDYEESPRLRIARAPGISDSVIASNTLPSPSSFSPQPAPNTTVPAAINSAPSLTEFLKTSAAADRPIATAPTSSPQLLALNKDQSKEKQLAKDARSVLPAVPVPTGSILNNSTAAPVVNQLHKKANLIASNGSKNSYSGLISPNSLLIDLINPPSLGVAVASIAPETVAQAIKPALAQAVAPGMSSTRPAYAHTKTLLAGLPNDNMSLGNVEQTSSNPAINQVNKSQVVTQNNPILNQPVLSTPINPTGSITGGASEAITPVAPKEIATSILTGTSVKGTTLTPILWGSDSANGAKFIAKLEEPLLANNKREALPAGTQLIVMARPNNNGNSGLNNSSSLVEVDVIGVIVQGKEYATPLGAIVIHDENNGLLVGEDYFKREEQIAGRDYMSVLGGALNTLGQVLNRPSGSFSSNTTGFGSSSTNIINNRDPNIFGALLEGGFKDIPGIWNQRNQQALAQLANQPKVYQIPKGRTIRVFVNQSIIF